MGATISPLDGQESVNLIAECGISGQEEFGRPVSFGGYADRISEGKPQNSAPPPLIIRRIPKLPNHYLHAYVIWLASILLHGRYVENYPSLDVLWLRNLVVVSYRQLMIWCAQQPFVPSVSVEFETAIEEFLETVGSQIPECVAPFHLYIARSAIPLMICLPGRSTPFMFLKRLGRREVSRYLETSPYLLEIPICVAFGNVLRRGVFCEKRTELGDCIVPEVHPPTLRPAAVDCGDVIPISEESRWIHGCDFKEKVNIFANLRPPASSVRQEAESNRKPPGNSRAQQVSREIRVMGDAPHLESDGAHSTTVPEFQNEMGSLRRDFPGGQNDREYWSLRVPHGCSEIPMLRFRYSIVD